MNHLTIVGLINCVPPTGSVAVLCEFDECLPFRNPHALSEINKARRKYVTKVLECLTSQQNRSEKASIGLSL